MSDPITFDRTMQIARSALDGLSTQQEVIGQNIANVDTPGYQAQQVDFQSALKNAINQTAPKVTLATTHTGHLASVDQRDRVQISTRKGGSERADGNDVDIDVELTQMSETVLNYQALSQLISKKFILLKQIVTGR